MCVVPWTESSLACLRKLAIPFPAVINCQQSFRCVCDFMIHYQLHSWIWLTWPYTDIVERVPVARTLCKGIIISRSIASLHIITPCPYCLSDPSSMMNPKPQGKGCNTQILFRVENSYTQYMLLMYNLWSLAGLSLNLHLLQKEANMMRLRDDALNCVKAWGENLALSFC